MGRTVSPIFPYCPSKKKISQIIHEVWIGMVLIIPLYTPTLECWERSWHSSRRAVPIVPLCYITPCEHSSPAYSSIQGVWVSACSFIAGCDAAPAFPWYIPRKLKGALWVSFTESCQCWHGQCFSEHGLSNPWMRRLCRLRIVVAGWKSDLNVYKQAAFMILYWG